MKVMLKIRTAKEDITPERAEKLHGYAPGFAKSVRRQITLAKKLDPKSRWGWCTVDVVAIVEIEGVRLEGRASLGGNSYTSELDFVKSSGYFDGMVKEAISEAIEQFNGAMAKAIGRSLQEFAS